MDLQAVDSIRAAMDQGFDKQLKAFFERKTFTARVLAIMSGHVHTALASHNQSTGNIVMILDL